TIDFDITAERETSREMATTAVVDPTKETEKLNKAQEELRDLRELVMRVKEGLSRLGRNHRYFRLRENRNFDTVRSTESRVFWLAIIQTGFTVLVAVAQVFVIQAFFGGSSGGGGGGRYRRV
ncbi:hypothetical protein HK405_012158, partial [Cladochytrium tenue]